MICTYLGGNTAQSKNEFDEGFRRSLVIGMKLGLVLNWIHGRFAPFNPLVFSVVVFVVRVGQDRQVRVENKRKGT